MYSTVCSWNEFPDFEVATAFVIARTQGGEGGGGGSEVLKNVLESDVT